MLKIGKISMIEFSEMKSKRKEQIMKILFQENFSLKNEVIIKRVDDMHKNTV